MHCENNSDVSLKRKITVNNEDDGCEVVLKRCKLSSVNRDWSLLDFPDEILLYILKFCRPCDLKCLGFTSERLYNLICNKTLWCNVVLDQQTTCSHLSWYIENVFNSKTCKLTINGYATQSKGCLGRVNGKRPRNPVQATVNSCSGTACKTSDNTPEQSPDHRYNENSDDSDMIAAENSNGDGVFPSRQPAQLFIRRHNQYLPRFSASPMWSDGEETSAGVVDGVECVGPRWSISIQVLNQLNIVSPHLTVLELNYCNINSSQTKMEHFPSGLRRLSLRGTRCYNLSLNKSYLFQIQNSLPLLEEVDVSECNWLDPSSFLPLSKLQHLRTLLATNCQRLTECVAYSSLAARYGFRSLEKLDISGTPLGDSEVSAFGWLPCLQQLYLSPPASTSSTAASTQHHHHYDDDPVVTQHETTNMDVWETQVPKYMKKQSNSETILDTQRQHPCSSTAVPKYVKFKRNYEIMSPSAGNSSQEAGGGSEPGPSTSSTEQQQVGGYVRFRRGETPTYIRPTNDINMNIGEESVTIRRINPSNNQQQEQEQRPRPEPAADREPELLENVEVEDLVQGQQNDGRVHIIYVNMRPPRHDVVRMMIPEQEQQAAAEDEQQRQPDNNAEHEHGLVLHLMQLPFIQNIFFRNSAGMSHLDGASLVSDTAIHRFGHSDAEQQNYIHIGPNGGARLMSGNERPRKSPLRTLVCHSFTGVTNRSLVHLVSAAPDLVYLDVRGTKVTQKGVEEFTSMRPDCKVLWGDI